MKLISELYNPFQPLLTNSGLKCFDLSLEQALASSALNGIVHSYLQISTVKPTPYPVIPDGTQAFYIAPYGFKLGGSHAQAFDIPLLEPGQYFGVRFHPGALRFFLDLDASEISSQLVDAQYFPSLQLDRLHNDIYQNQSFSGRVNICEQWLLSKVKPQLSTRFDLALSKIYQSFGNVKVSHLSSEVGWSSRHLNRIFQLYTGLSTKKFMQTIRVQHACRLLYTLPSSSPDMALGLGYFDQSHFLNDYKKRLLLNPNDFFDRFRSDFYNS
ncbi:helix-turn-helix domain-containing protein [Thaumasiovibrio sp. DFM-14]|uniref:AraC family transcriptional regulator n=1 Tax=Thaumasiovibrio sp. DFM-14 TaxID=3384792 RepID=UPI00399F5D0C